MNGWLVISCARSLIRLSGGSLGIFQLFLFFYHLTCSFFFTFSYSFSYFFYFSVRVIVTVNCYNTAVKQSSTPKTDLVENRDFALVKGVPVRILSERLNDVAARR